MRQLYIEFPGGTDLEVEVADDVELDTRFAATCMLTGERLWVQGWLASSIVDFERA